MHMSNILLASVGKYRTKGLDHAAVAQSECISVWIVFCQIQEVFFFFRETSNVDCVYQSPGPVSVSASSLSASSLSSFDKVCWFRGFSNSDPCQWIVGKITSCSDSTSRPSTVHLEHHLLRACLFPIIVSVSDKNATSVKPLIVFV